MSVGWYSSWAPGVVAIFMLGVAQRTRVAPSPNRQHRRFRQTLVARKSTPVQCIPRFVNRYLGGARYAVWLSSRLVPRPAAVDEFAVRIEPAQRRLANIQTAKAVRKPVTTSVRTIGNIQIDESRQATIASYISGTSRTHVRRLYGSRMWTRGITLRWYTALNCIPPRSNSSKRSAHSTVQLPTR